ncbi:hypothetical protein BDV25DRAFT_136908 [Aspergillus avenaceus]|uniref:6-methylsalicylate decarboxylase n=1 Tax=Aspergillus avenaceus TaxID=36643 RepID=A0A5N6U4F9_ASPAV|nr:hypothetical protein BDV25DRAFT_136908 [Aspergillus avenaceus]
MASSKIDFHTHFIPPFYRTLLEKKYPQPDGMPGYPAWSVESHLEFMETNGIKKSILSLSSPGVDGLDLGDEDIDAASLARQVNDFAADVKRQNPERFGFLASLPLSDEAACLAEIKRALSPEVNADGFMILSNTQGRYLGDPSLRTVLRALNEVGALVFVHPTIPCHHGNGGHLAQNVRVDSCCPLAAHYKIPIFEFLFDEARTIFDLVASGAATENKQIKWLVPHCGGVIPTIIDRMFLVERLGIPYPHSEGRNTSGCKFGAGEEETRRIFREQFYYDIMGNPVGNLLDSLLKFVGKEQLVFGTDTPWMPFARSNGVIKQLEEDLPGVVGEEWVSRVYHGNGEKLLARE